jgi:hypothetical protein
LDDLSKRNLGKAMAGMAILALGGCGANAATNATTAVTGAVGAVTATISTTVSEATQFWATIKGFAEVGAAALTIANPVAGAAVTAAITAGDSIIASLPGLGTDIVAVGNALGQLFSHVISAVQGAAPAVKVTAPAT